MEKLTKNELLKLKNELIHGDMQRIADATGRGVHTVRRFFRGDIYCYDVLEETLRLLNKRRQAYKKAKEMISSFSSQTG